MPKICYKSKKMGPSKLLIVRAANLIISEYMAKGYDLTLRQVYYQFVARDLFPDDWRDPKTGSTNNLKSYSKLKTIIGEARMAGLVDWDAIVDRTRFVRSISTWDSPSEIISICARTFKLDKWKEQHYRPEVWIEKDALVGVVEPVCQREEIPFLACRGYTSLSELWSSARRLFQYLKGGQVPVILHLGDLDPSGMDMTRDIKERMEDFIEINWLAQMMNTRNATRGQIWESIREKTGVKGVQVRRIALNMNQVEEYNPPPNPAKATDARFKKFSEEYGDESWELDALDPTVVGDLISSALAEYREEDKWEESVTVQEKMRNQLQVVSNRWEDVMERFADEGEFDA
jgi:hypothetical protein